jgi:hypothetical protein
VPILGLHAVVSCSEIRVIAVEIATIELEPTTAAIVVGESVQLEARLRDEAGNLLTGRDIKWSSSDPVAAPVDERGLVRGEAPGAATITAASAEWRASAEIAVNRPEPRLTAIQPASAQRLQTVDLTLTGSNFEEAATTVDLGAGITLDNVTIASPQSINVRATVQVGATLGPRNISVTNAGPGGGTATLANGFTVLAQHPAPSLTAVSPGEGQRQTTVPVTLTGSGFVSGLTTVSFGPDITVSDVAVVSATSLTATLVIGSGASLGARNVTVTNPAPGGGSATLAGRFTVLDANPVPTLSAVSPAEGQRNTAVPVTLTGSGFVSGLTTVSFGPDITVNDVAVVSATSLTATLVIEPSASLGAPNVTVTNPAPGGGSATLVGGFTVVDANPIPTLSAVSPAEGQRQATLPVTLTGSGFGAGLTTVSFGPDITVSDVVVVSATSLTATLVIGSGASLGARNVTVTNPAPGGGSATLTGGFTVRAANPVPSLTAVSPAEGQRLTSLNVILTGSGFMDATTVSFGPDISVSAVTVSSATSLTATIGIPAGATLGPRDVTVTNPAPGGGSATRTGGFTVLPEHPQPTIDDIEPSTMQRQDTRDVTLTGSGFVPGVTTVSFGPDITIEEVRVTSPASLTATVRIHASATLGTRPVSVINPAPGGGTATLSDRFTVLQENPPPSASEVIPAVGLRGATLNVTILGSGFVQGLTSVSFGQGIAVNAVNVALWTSLTANITIASDAQPGPRDVSVHNSPPGGGTFILHNAFRVLPGGN